MSSRKDLKKRALASVKRNYWLFMIFIIAVSALKIEYSSSLTFMHVKSDPAAVREILLSENNIFNKKFVKDPLPEDPNKTPQQTYDGSEQFIISAWAYLTEDFTEAAESDFEINMDLKVPVIEKLVTHVNDKGIIASTVNSFTSGIPVSKIIAASYSAAKYHDKNPSGLFFVILGNAAYLAVVFFFAYTARIIMRRSMLEARLYRRIEGDSIFRQLLIGRWTHSSYVLFMTFIYHLLWSFTIVGYFVKRYSYWMVPYIVAENPEIKTRDAIKLSRRMMNGYKWHCFKMDMSFIGWHILKIVTLGASALFFSSSYHAAFFCEYYVDIRKLAIENGVEGVEILNDKYLFEYAPDEEIKTAYADAFALESVAHAKAPSLGKIRDFFLNTFNLVFYKNDKTEEIDKKFRASDRYETAEDVLNHKLYPVRLSPSEKKRKYLWQNYMISNRVYPLVSVVLMFILVSMIGWTWEVCLHLIWDGKLVNRGMLHGPWLPVYGSGSILLMLVLNKFRKRPVRVFFATTAICGVVEYMTAFMLFHLHDGEKWWDYSGYLVNLHGRICAEGLVVFGFAGILFLYVLAPLFDNIFSKINKKIVYLIAIILVALFIYDNIYSSEHPNAGAGVTMGCESDYETNFCMGVNDEIK